MVALPDEIRSEPLSKALAERYLAYLEPEIAKTLFK